MTEYAKHIRELRIQSGRSQEEMAKLLEMSDMSYFDLEAHDDELCRVPSIRQVQTMCDIFGIGILELFTTPESQDELNQPISFQELMSKVKNHIDSQGLSTEEFEDGAGWYLSEFIENPERIWEEPIMFLQDVCAPIGIDWRLALPRENAQLAAGPAQ